MTYMTEHVVSLFTPTGGICGKPGLLQSQKEDNSENDFLFTGKIGMLKTCSRYALINLKFDTVILQCQPQFKVKHKHFTKL